MRSWCWGRRPLMGNYWCSIRGSVLDRLPNRHDWFYSRSISSNEFFCCILSPNYSSILLVIDPQYIVFLNLTTSWSDYTSSARVSVFLLFHAIHSMVVYRTVLPLSCPPIHLLPQWGKSHLHGAPSRASGCVFESRGISCKFLSFLFFLPLVTVAHVVLMTLSFLVWSLTFICG